MRSRKDPAIRLDTFSDLGPEERAVRIVDGDLVAGTSGEYYDPSEAAPMLFELVQKSGGTIDIKTEITEGATSIELGDFKVYRIGGPLPIWPEEFERPKPR